MKLDPQQFVFVPGNHDVCWPACKRVEADQEELQFGDLEFRRRVDGCKLKNFEDFVEQFQGVSDNRVSIVPNCGAFVEHFGDLGLSVAGLNSCEMESHRCEDHRGLISERQAQAIMDYWRGSANDRCLKVIAVHHNPVATAPGNVKDWVKQLEVMANKGELKRDVFLRFAGDGVGLEGFERLRALSEDCEVQLLLHGHQHASAQEAWTWRRGHKGVTQVLSAGSWGLGMSKLPQDEPNSMQIVLLDPENGELTARRIVYQPAARAPGVVRVGCFVSDPVNRAGYIGHLCV